eukprot:CAMPEP_0118805660 /NCGR_PEP_ID=MMETSP1161-20130426/28292_1 /TAXON_ID=249345 /ORGANISM="Picochlorum oklahomensis, Strain CCMP2329" /LENGTH=119 /DNA_ID=CAMNT_0006734649 /DNA_START=29 /DNA_END=388 /DNA_ORIENTATION=+
MAARPFNVSASGENGPNASLFVELSIGIKLAALNKTKLKNTPVGSSDHCFKTVSPEDNSAPNAEMNASMANLPLIISGPGPENAITSAMLISWLAASVGSAGAGATTPCFTASAHSFSE